MPASSPPVGPKIKEKLRRLGERIRERRKQLGLSAVATAEAAGISRVTLHRIERGEISVTIGAYYSALASLGLDFRLEDESRDANLTSSGPSEIPERIHLNEYPHLKKLAWQIDQRKYLSPREALDLIEGNWRHIQLDELTPKEDKFIRALLAHFGRERLLV